MFGPCFVMEYLVSFLVLTEEGAGCFTLIKQMSRGLYSGGKFIQNIWGRGKNKIGYLTYDLDLTN